MAKWLVERKLRQSAARLKSLREELQVINDQLAHLSDDAGDMSIRSLVSGNTGFAYESRQAQEHADAMAKHRAHVVAQIAELEQHQDMLLDRMVG